MPKKPLTKGDLQFVGESIIMIKDTDRCLGDLIHFDGKGTFCPNNGRVPVSKEAADVHNKALDQARVEGLDENCEVGMRGMFYWDGKNVKTFLGTQVNEGFVVMSGNVRKTVYFNRKGMKFKGVLRKDADCFSAVRTA
jgi:hypothetical protein